MKSLIFLSLLIVASALGVVYTKYSSRELRAQIERLTRDLEDLDAELGQLQLDQHAWAEHGRIEKLARTKLKMVLPQRDAIEYIKPTHSTEQRP